MEIVEAFDAPQPIRWVEQGPEYFEGYFEQGGERFMLYFEETDHESEDRLVWNVEFSHVSDDRTLTRTNTGLTPAGATKVFATTISAMEFFLKKIKPNELAFSGKRTVFGLIGMDRGKLYSIMAKVMQPRLDAAGYSVSSRYNPTKQETEFLISKTID